ncbi:translocation/assembly module TamB domain-containing protein [Marivirga salinae]|uniref:Translocation/assembly module TamB domain-containing protein n=1 Tax=Marivirga salinarum TaxID=3059078 RepID=A0AA51N9K0_9BACT|nr:translocation/assembly module TamB domain-containing protein [Marivirga sp. BDSF4-3]WMN10790.1 translocation/assembly module TamB domain-containing protein [Marivirga sp. BDSF4-3]
MKEEQNITQGIKKGIAKAILWVFLVLFFSMSVLVLAMQSSAVQTRVAQYGSEYLSEKLGFEISIEKINIEWFDQITLTGLHIKNKDKSNFIELKSIWIDYDIKQLINDESILFDNLRLEDGRVMLIRQKGDNYFNIDYLVEAIRNLSAPKKDSSRSKAKNLLIREATLSNIILGVANLDSDSIKDGFNYNQFVLHDLNADLNNLSSRADTIQMQINQLSAVDSVTDLTIHHLNSNFEISQSRLSLTELNLEVNKSTIADSIVFNYNSINDLSYIIDSVNINANFKNSVIFTEDLALFAPYIKKYEDKINLSGNFNGKVKRFKANDLNMKFGNSSFIQGDIRIDGLPNFSESFIDLDLTNSSLTPADLKQYVNDSLSYQRIQNFGITNFRGSFIGFPTDFVADGVFTSPLGRVESDLNLKIDKDSRKSTYKGSLSTFNFDLGKFMDADSIFQKVQMTGNIQGSGFTLETAKLNLNANINLIGINGYEYQNITTNAELASEFFNGKLKINDPLLKFQMDGSIDLRKNKNLINVTADLDTINFKDLNITKEDFILTAKGTLNGSGIELDSIEGTTSLQKIYAVYRGNSLQLDSLNVNTSNQNGNRKLKINSDLFRANIDGGYQFTQLQKDLFRTVKEYQLNIENDQNKIKNYYEVIDTTVNLEEYTVNFDFLIKEINPLINLFIPKLYVEKGAKIKGQFQNGENSTIFIESSFDSIKYDNYIFSENTIDLNFSKYHLSQNVLGIGFINSANQQLNTNLQSENLNMELYWTGREINFSSFLEQAQSENHLNISGNLEFLEDSLNLSIEKSDIEVFSKNWGFVDNNNLKISSGNYIFKNFGIASNDERIIANGELSKDSTKSLLIEIDSFNVENINELVEQHDFKGTANGFIDIQNFQNQFLLSTELSLLDFYLDEFLIGNISGFSSWQPEEKKLLMNYTVQRQNQDIIKVDGTYAPSVKVNPLDLKAKLRKTNLVIVEPFINTIFSDMRGEIDGEFQITGNINRPIVNGTGKISNGGIRVNYLNTYYDYTGNINFNQEKVTFENIQLTDDQGNNGYLNGDLLHDGFTDLRLDLMGNMNELKVLNTSARDNELYYGTAFVSGTVTFSGSVGNLTIDAQAKSENGTRIFIPVESTSTVEREEYIHFINIKDTANNKTQEINRVEEVDIKGVTMNFDLELTPDAYAEIIFDIKSGDIIRGRGNGKLSMNIDTNGAFSMIGDYTLTEGGYNFTLYNIINKEFSIQQGSQITWDGDPYKANLDIQAVYEQNVSLLPIVNMGQDSSLANSPELKRRYPAKVLLYLDGDLLQPEVDFDINFSDYPDQIITEARTTFPLRTSVTAFEAELDADEQEMKRQVFSLIILRRLSPRASFAVSGSVGNSVSEFLSNQLSYWVTQIDENLEIDVDLGSFDEDQFNTFQLRLSYSFLGGRLRITRDGGFTQGETENVNQEILGILGDWSVEYLLTRDGKLRAKIYNRTNFNTLDRINNTNTASTSTGVSLVHVTSFDQLREVFENTKKDKKEESEDKKEEPQKINTDAVLREEDENSK